MRRIITMLGGITAVAAELGHRNVTTVQGWWDRDIIPALRQREVLDLARRMGAPITADDLIPGAAEAPAPLEPELCDWFAGVALAGIAAAMTGHRQLEIPPENWHATVAREAYGFARAMIAERAKRVELVNATGATPIPAPRRYVTARRYGPDGVSMLYGPWVLTESAGDWDFVHRNSGACSAAGLTFEEALDACDRIEDEGQAR